MLFFSILSILFSIDGHFAGQSMINARMMADFNSAQQQQYRRRNHQIWNSRMGGGGDQTATTINGPSGQYANAKELQKKVKRPPSLLGSNSHREQPLSVKLGFYLESLGDFRETQMSFEVDLYMYMSWKDPSLQHPGPDMLMINEDIVRKQLWLPDLYFANARQANFHQVTVPNFNLFISPDGTIAYSSRVTLNVACNLDLVDYPIDYQECHIRVLSYAYIAKIVNVTWFRQSPIMYNPDIDLPEFEIDHVGAEYCDGTYRYAVTDKSSKTDRFSCLMANLYLRRRIGFNMVQSYIPTALIVIISWVSFWIDRRAVPGRVMISFTTFLTMITIGNGMRFALPRVSYAKAIDFWFGGCMLFVFSAVVEFAFVNSYMRRSDKYERLANKYKRKASTDMLTMSPIFVSELAQSYAEMMKLRRKSNFFDFASSPIVNRRKLTKDSSREDISLSLSEDTTEQSKASGKSGKQQNGKKQGPNVDFMGRNLGQKQQQNAEIMEGLNGSYYGQKCELGKENNPPKKKADNMHSMNPAKRGSDRQTLVEQLPNGMVKRKVNDLPSRKGNSVAFAMEEAPKNDGMEPDGNKEGEEDLLWPNSAENEQKVEPNPQLYCKYLEVSQLLARRALNIDKTSRVLFPIAFILFNCLYWGFYLVFRRRNLED